MKNGELKQKRVYEEVEDSDGYRILIDRLWPRGLKKEVAALDYWAKPITPTAELRKKYHAEEIPYAEFAARYKEELEENSEAAGFVELIQEKLEQGNVTLVFAAKEPEKSHVPTLCDYLMEKTAGHGTSVE